MGMLQHESPLLCRAGIIAADPPENIGSFRNESHADFIHLDIFPRSLDRAIRDRIKGRVSVAMLHEKDKKKENAEQIRALWRKYKGMNSILAECMQRAIGATLHDKNHMLDEEFPEQAQVLNDEVKERRKKRSATCTERKDKVDRTHSTLANQRTSVEEGRDESKRDKRLQSTNMYARETSI